ncbi:hypothetical protein IJH74_02545 [Candidatus Saccharibacteria bacterium]|nr:hypothetical protein [Candidatus Saccharibacteria bacterium]
MKLCEKDDYGYVCTPSQNGDFAYLDKSYGGTGENRTDTSDPAWQRLGGNTNNYGRSPLARRSRF